MAQYCKLAGRVTNCTDNCRICLEEEAKTREIEIGDKVRYIAEDSEATKETGYYPPKGKIGTVIGIDSIFLSLRTTSNGRKERPSGMGVGMSKEKTSSWFDKKLDKKV